MDDFLDDLLIDFIRKDLDMDYLAGRMEKLVETGTRPEEVLPSSRMRLLQRQGNTEIQADHSSSAGLHPAQYEKQRADYMFVQRQYGKAKARYEVARSVAVTMELSEDIKEELFGVRGGKGEILRNGAFPEELVQKALYEASVRNT